MPWNETDREKYAVIHEHYASDLSDEEFALVNGQQWLRVAILNVRRSHLALDRQTKGIDRDVALAAFDLFARVVASRAARLGGFDRLTISRPSTVRLLPPRLAGGINGATKAHSSSVRSWV
jgi:hypothetical protein